MKSSTFELVPRALETDHYFLDRGGGGDFHMQTFFVYAAPAANNFLVCLRLPANTLFFTCTHFSFSVYSLSNLFFFFFINFPSLPVKK